MVEPRVQYAKTSDGVSIAYATHGEGWPLVCCLQPFSHVVAAYELLKEVWQELEKDFRLVRYDARGTGLSDRTAGDFSLEAALRDLDAVIEAAQLSEFAFLASADGPPVAISYAAGHPEQVSHLVMLDGWSALEDNQVAGLEMERAARGQDWVLFTETFVRVLMDLEGPEATRMAKFIRDCIDPETYVAYAPAVDGWDVRNLLPRVKAPTLLVHMPRNKFFPLELGRRVASNIPGARLIISDAPNTPAAFAEMPSQCREFILGIGKPAVASRDVHTILFTDLVSSTALTQRLGDAKAQELVRAHNSIVREALKANGGTEIKHTGDGIMASFPTASGALECAVAIQRGIADRADASLQVHIGLNAGEPVAEDSDLFGTSVQLARRICDHAESGQILASNVVRELAAGKGFLFADIGEVVPKGFEEPVRLYEVRWRD